MRGQEQDAAVAEQAAPRVVRDGHAAEVAAVDARDPVVARQPLVHEGVVGRQQVQHAAVLAHHALEQQFRLAAERLAEVVVEVREVVLVRNRGPQVPQLQPLPGEVSDQRLGAAIGQHAAHLPLQHRRLPQLALRGHVHQLVVGDAAPQEEREARGELEIVHDGG